jgi:hypothetical protein
VADGEEVVIIAVAGTIDSTPIVDCPFCSGYITAEMWTRTGATFAATCICGGTASWHRGEQRIVFRRPAKAD